HTAGPPRRPGGRGEPHASDPEDTGLEVKALGLVLLAGAALALPAAGGSAGDPGITSDQILIGGTVPLSGPASPFGAVGPGANAYFKYVNAHGGVYGRKIKYLYRDDGYDPSRTIEQTR